MFKVSRLPNISTTRSQMRPPLFTPDPRLQSLPAKPEHQKEAVNGLLSNGPLIKCWFSLVLGFPSSTGSHTLGCPRPFSNGVEMATRERKSQPGEAEVYPECEALLWDVSIFSCCRCAKLLGASRLLSWSLVS